MGTPRGHSGKDTACHSGCPDPALLHLLGLGPPGHRLPGTCTRARGTRGSGWPGSDRLLPRAPQLLQLQACFVPCSEGFISTERTGCVLGGGQ